MGMDLRGALLGAGLVDESAIARAEAERAKEIERANIRVAKDEHDRRFAREWGAQHGGLFAEKPKFYFWLRDGRAPKNAGEICCVCGKAGKPESVAVLETASIIASAGVTPLEVMASGDHVAIGMLRGLMRDGLRDVLSRFETAAYPELVELLRGAQAQAQICGACERKMLGGLADLLR